ncbi:MAG: hypothetical protein AB7V13_06120 [Pseudorhodoplanes sp.]
MFYATIIRGNVFAVNGSIVFDYPRRFDAEIVDKMIGFDVPFGNSRCRNEQSGFWNSKMFHVLFLTWDGIFGIPLACFSPQPAGSSELGYR